MPDSEPVNHVLKDVLRWTIALAVLGALVLYALPRALDALKSSVSLGGDLGIVGGDDETPTDDTTAIEDAPVGDGQAGPVADFALTGTVATGLTAAEVTLANGPGNGFVVVFDRIPADLACLDSIALELTITQADPTELTASPIAVDPSGVVEGQPAPLRPVAGDGALALAATDGTPGRLSFDVLGVYRALISSIGSQDKVAVLIAPSAVPEGEEVQLLLLTVESGPEGGPALKWTGSESCA